MHQVCFISFSGSNLFLFSLFLATKLISKFVIAKVHSPNSKLNSQSSYKKISLYNLSKSSSRFSFISMLSNIFSYTRSISSVRGLSSSICSDLRPLFFLYLSLKLEKSTGFSSFLSVDECLFLFIVFFGLKDSFALSGLQDFSRRKLVLVFEEVFLSFSLQDDVFDVEVFDVIVEEVVVDEVFNIIVDESDVVWGGVIDVVDVLFRVFGVVTVIFDVVGIVFNVVGIVFGVSAELVFDVVLEEAFDTLVEECDVVVVEFDVDVE